jgi:pimeloyl-ACP methyl ester carboxylesterase
MGLLAGVVVLPLPSGAWVGAGFAHQDGLARLSPEQAERMIAARPSRELAIRNAHPERVAAWWARKDAAERSVMIHRSPSLVGNLDGVDYASRDAANRRQLGADLRAARTARHRSPQDDGARARLRSLQAIASATDGRSTPARGLVSYVRGAVPLAAISVGDLDTATHVTMTIPGMGTTTADMQLWTEAAQNLWMEQGDVGAPEDRAVVAWIRYRTPAPGISATAGHHARRGAPLLAAEIQGLRAARTAGSTPSIDVVAHSYGSTMAADALAARDLGVRSFVMLGSAGVERTISSADALHVQHVFAAEASDDWDAIWGRIARRDPRDTAFGATVFGVDGDDARELLGVTGHAPVLHSAWNDDPFSRAWTRFRDPVERAERYIAHQEAFGYLDADTESLRNTAIATTPQARERLTHLGA